MAESVKSVTPEPTDVETRKIINMMCDVKSKEESCDLLVSSIVEPLTFICWNPTRYCPMLHTWNRNISYETVKLILLKLTLYYNLLVDGQFERKKIFKLYIIHSSIIILGVVRTQVLRLVHVCNPKYKELQNL